MRGDVLLPEISPAVAIRAYGLSVPTEPAVGSTANSVEAADRSGVGAEALASSAPTSISPAVADADPTALAANSPAGDLGGEATPDASPLPPVGYDESGVSL